MRNIIFILAIIFVSCETTVNPNLPHDGPGIVFYSFFRPGTPLRIDVFNTVPILQTETIQRNEDLTIRLLENGEFVEEVMANAQGSYISSIIPVAQNNYSFETTSGKYFFSASSHIPAPVGISRAQMSDEIEHINAGKYGYPAEIALTDPGETNNFYSFEVLVQNCSRGCTDDNVDGDLNEILVEELKVNTSGNTDVEIGGNPQEIDGLKCIYFSDEGFNGEAVTLKFFLIPTLINLNRSQNVKFVLKSVTREYYEYLRTSDFQKELEESGNLSEPVQIATNIGNGGLGTFAGYSFSLHNIKH